MKNFVTLALLSCFCTTSFSQTFDDHFTNQTLRLDYQFVGDSAHQAIYLDQLLAFPTWAGRKHQLSELPLAGNGRIIVKEKESNQTIYTTSFSSLFQEWICEEEATHTQRSFENVFLIPYPKKEVAVTVELTNKYHETTASFTHVVKPTDILIQQRGNDSVTPYRYLLQSGENDQCIDIAIVAEGYRAEEMELFYEEAERTCDAIFSHEPFGKHRSSFNVVAVASPSLESGVSIPRNGDWKETALGAHFDTFYSDRYLTTSQIKRLHNTLLNIPYEHIIILTNAAVYGGGGIYNSYTIATSNKDSFRPVIVHEFGHSFGGLGDEYAYGDEPSPYHPYSVEPWEQNITTLVDFKSKWEDMVPPHTSRPTPPIEQGEEKYKQVGLYEGAGYTRKGIYRLTTDCRMRTNEAPDFCPVCQRALERLINFYTKPNPKE
ncbi:MAG: M64 family metallopeptidase [Phocaeicola sp.]